MKIKSIQLNKIVDFSNKTNNSKFTKSFIEKHKGDIPVYSASKDPHLVSYGFVKNNLRGVRYFNDCLTWNIDGSVGHAFLRKGHFSLSEKVIPIVPFDEWKDKIDLEYLGYLIEIESLKCGFGYDNKAGKSKLSNLILEIPLIEEQKKRIKKIKKILDIQNQITAIGENIKKTKIKIEEGFNFSSVLIPKVFNIKKGRAKYTVGYMREHKGKYPVYSSQTEDFGIIGHINTYDYNCECLTWTTDGIYAGTVFIRNGKFSMTTHCGALLPKKEFANQIFLPFIYYQLDNTLKSFAVGEDNKRITATLIKNLSINIPIDKKGAFDLSIQTKISKKYEIVENIKNNLIDKLELLTKSKIKID